MTTDNLKRYVIPNLPYLFLFWFCDKLGEAYRIAPGRDFLQKLTNSVVTLTTAFQSPLPSFHPNDLLVGLAGAAIIYAVVYYKKKNAKKWRKDVEYGSARWGTPADIKPYMDPKPENNIILTQTEGLTMSSRPKNPKHARNTGMDIAVPVGTQIHAAAAGKVLFTRANATGYGTHVAISHGGGIVTLYAHCSKLLVGEGQKVAQGEVIALSGNTGRSTGPHLHLEFVINGTPRDPRFYL